MRELVGEELFIPIDLRGGKGWGPVKEEGGITLCQADGQALVEVPDLLELLLPSVSGQSCTQMTGSSSCCRPS